MSVYVSRTISPNAVGTATQSIPIDLLKIELRSVVGTWDTCKYVLELDGRQNFIVILQYVFVGNFIGFYIQSWKVLSKVFLALESKVIDYSIEGFYIC